MDTVSLLETIRSHLLSTFQLAFDEIFPQKEDSAEEFVNTRIDNLGRLITAYKTVFQRVGVQSRTELEKTFKLHYRNPDVQDALEELLDYETRWDKTLVSIDQRLLLDSLSTPLAAGDALPALVFRDVRTSEAIPLAQFVGSRHVEQLEQRRAEFDVASCQVVIISFGEMKGAHQWLQQTGCRFPMLVDHERRMYRALGFKRSVAQVWNISTVSFYAGQAAKGVALPRPMDDIEDDPHQMGGNCLVDESGRLMAIYQSSTPADRPSVEWLLNGIQVNDCASS